MDSNKTLEEAYKMIANGNSIVVNVWETELFSLRWWFGVTLSILPWIIWVKIRDKKKTVRTLFVGLMAMLLSVTMDNLGLIYGLWHYQYKVTPCCAAFFPFNFSLFPVGVMLILQFNPQISPYIKALVFALFSAFIFEPFFIWMKMYHLIHYKCWYSVFIYIPLYLFFNYIYKSKLFNIETNT